MEIGDSVKMKDPAQNKPKFMTILPISEKSVLGLKNSHSNLWKSLAPFERTANEEQTAMAKASETQLITQIKNKTDPKKRESETVGRRPQAIQKVLFQMERNSTGPAAWNAEQITDS
jgi:hypothetical protein